MRFKIVSITMIVSFISLSFFPSIISTIHYNKLNNDEWNFKDSKLLIIGRVRTAYSANGKWRPPLYIGNESFAGIFSEGTPLERLNVVIKNKTATNFLYNLKNVEVRMINTSGIFFISEMKQISVRKIPPLTVILSSSDKIIIRPFP